jgi:DNA sulfur modification protein DndD
MWIRRLVLDNFRSFYSRHDIAFDKGINTVLGPNGAGKTTLIKALEYCLFGITENVTEKEIINDKFKDECLKKRKTPCASVWIELRHGERQYVIRREFYSPQDGRIPESLTVNGENVENSWIHEHLILPEDFELMNIIGVKLNTLVKSFRSKRSAVRDLIGLPLISKISRSTTMAYNEYVSQTKWAEEQQSAKIARRELLESELEGIHKRIGELEINESEAKAELDTAKTLLQEARKKIDSESTSLYTEIEGLQAQQQRVSEQLEEERKNFGEMQDNLPYFVVLSKVREKIGQIRKAIGRNINEFFRHYGFLEGQLEALQKYIGKVKPDDKMKGDSSRAKKELETILQALPGRKLPSREEFREYMRIERLLNFVEYLEKMAGKSEGYPVLEKKILELEAKEFSLMKRLEDARSLFRRRGKKTTEIAKLDGKVEALTRRHASVTTELERLRRDRDLKTKEVKDIISDLSKYSQMSDEEEKYARRAFALKSMFEDLVQRHEKDKITKIGKRAHELFLDIIEKPELFTGLELTHDYDVKLHEKYYPKGEIPTTRPSTGETDVMYISVALALNMESGNKMVILDDATINLDNKHTRKVLDAINEFGFEQVIMICKDTIKNLVLTRLDSSKVYDVQFDKIKETSTISPIVGG